MTSPWNWISLGALAALAIYQQFRMRLIHRRSKQREELFQIVTENAADMIALVDMKGRRLYNSPAYKRILGYSAAELGETSSFEQIHVDDRFKVLEAAREARSTGVGRRMEYRIRHKDGTWRILESIASAIRNEKGEVTKLVIVNRDVTERRRAQEQAEQNSFRDALTGLPNRRLFLDRLQHLYDRALRGPGRQYAVLFVDLDGFKVFRETTGPALSDLVIVEVGHRLEACLRDEDTISRPQDQSPTENAVLSRLGGDEFTVLLEGVTDPSDVMRVANRILSSVGQPFLVNGREIRSSVSVGIALSTAAHRRAEDLLQEADVAMRRAKALGGARCEMFDEAMHSRVLRQLKLENELQQAWKAGQFRVYYQPIVQLSTGQIAGFEALLRWQHPQQGLISPHKFLVTAEDSGLLTSAGQWLILEACRQLRTWTNENPALGPLGMSANISARRLADARFVPEIEAALRETGIAPSQLNLEFTEAVAAADPKLTAAVISNLRQLRVGVILDDFGAGHSSLLELRQLPMEALKIDCSLVSGMLLDRGVSDTVELIFAVAHKLKLKVIAKGIASARQLDHLLALGCELGEGNLFSHPVEAKAAHELLRERGAASYAKTKAVGAQQ